MSNWYIELSHVKWQSVPLEKAVRAWLDFNKDLLRSISIQLVEQLGNDLRIAKALSELRQEMQGSDYLLPGTALALKISQAASRLRLHLTFNAELVPASAWPLLENQLLAFYQNPNLKLTPINLKELPAQAKTHDYWMAQAKQLPAAPQLGEEIGQTAGPYRYVHNYGRFTVDEYQAMKSLSEEHKFSLTLVLLTTMTDLLQRKTSSPWFRVNLTLLNRIPLYPYQNDRASYATTLACLPIETQDGESFLDRLKNLDQQLRTDTSQLDRQALPALNKVKAQEQGGLPFTFTSQLDQDLDINAAPFYSEPADVMESVGMEPRSDFRVDVWEQGDELHYRWSYTEKQQAELQGLFKTFGSQLKKVAAIAAVPGLAAAGGSQLDWFKPTQFPNLISNTKQPLLAQQKSDPESSVATLQAQSSPIVSEPIPTTPLEKMQSSMKAMGKTDLNPIHLPDLAIPPVLFSAIQGKTLSQIQGLHKAREEKLVEEHYKESPAMENYNQSIIHFSQLLEDTRQYSLQDPYFEDFQAIDDTAAEVCASMLAGQAARAKEKIAKAQEHMDSLKQKMKDNPIPDTPDDPLIKSMRLMDEQLDALDESVIDYASGQLDESEVMSRLNSLDSLTSQLDMTSQLDASKVHKEALLNRKGDLANQMADHKAKVAGLSPQEAMLAKKKEAEAKQAELLEQQKTLADKQDAALEKFNDAQKPYEKFNNLSCDDVKGPAGQTALAEYGTALNEMKDVYPINSTHQKITALSEDLDTLQKFYDEDAKKMAEGQAKNLADAGKLAASAELKKAQEAALVNNVTASAADLKEDSKANFCDKQLGPLAVGQCGTMIPLNKDPYPKAKSSVMGFRGKIQSKINSEKSFVLNLQTQAAAKLAEAEQFKENMKDSQQALKDKSIERGEGARDRAQKTVLDEAQSSNTAEDADSALKNAQEAKTHADQAVQTVKTVHTKLEGIDERLGGVYKRWDSFSPQQSADGLTSSALDKASLLGAPFVLAGKSMTRAQAKDAAGKMALEQSGKMKEKVAACGGDPSLLMKAGIPSETEMIARFTPPIPEEIAGRTEKEVLSKMTSLVAQSKGDAQKKLNDATNEVGAGNACVKEHIKKPEEGFMDAVKAGAAVQCTFGSNQPKMLVLASMAPKSNGATLAQPHTYNFGSMGAFGNCMSGSHPEAASGKPPPYTCLMAPEKMAIFDKVSRTLANGVGILQKGGTAPCLIAGGSLAITDAGEDPPKMI